MYLTLYANERGEVLEHPALSMLGRTGLDWVGPEKEEMIPLPKGSSLVSIPDHIPVGLDRDENLSYFELDPMAPQRKVYAVAALLPQGFTRTLLPACVSSSREAVLPLMGYTAVGLKNDKIYVAAVQSDEHRKWHPVNYNTEGLESKIHAILKKMPENRIARQLARCSLEYGCFTAQNIFYQRWEGGIPTSRACNANCIACISESHGGVDSPQNRIDFNPSVEEICQLGTEHLERAQDAIISFGQGCEGEPSLNARNLSRAIQIIRDRTEQGTININTNAGYSEGIKAICDAGLDSMRVTIFSCKEENYNKYHRPNTYCFKDVESSIRYAKEKGKYVAINLLVFPGFSDREEEIEHLLDFVKRNDIDMIQLRNLNIDPELLWQSFESEMGGIGINKFLALLKQEMPQLKLGSYTHPIR